MKYFVLGGLIIVFLVHKTWADEVSLIEGDQAEEEILSSQNNQLHNYYQNEEMDEDDLEDSDYEKINDFIHEQDQKLRDIKLLNLDLEKVSLEFRKREFEQKLSQLNRSEGIVSVGNAKPSVKLLGILQNSLKKEAILNINGVDQKLTEGQMFNGVVVTNISSQGVVIEYFDGEKQELGLL